MKTMEVYESPVVEVIEVEIEKGFAVSDGIERIGDRKEEMGW